MSSAQNEPSATTNLIPTEKRNKMTESDSNDLGNVPSKVCVSSDRKPSLPPSNAPIEAEHQKLSLISPEVRSLSSTPAKNTGTLKRFAEITLEMINFLSNEEPDLMGWADDDQHFYVNNHSHLDRVGTAMKPFFDHGNFASFRRQLSAYNFTRVHGGKYNGYWYHPRFHRFSNDHDIQELQTSRRRRGQGPRSPRKSSKPAGRSRRIKIRAPAATAPCIKSPKIAQVQGSLLDFPTPEGAHMLILDSMASLFPLASLAKDEVLSGGVVDSEKAVTPNSMQASQKDTGLAEYHPFSSVIACTPIKPNNFAFPLLCSAFSPNIRQGTVHGLTDYSEELDDDDKENSTDQVIPFPKVTDPFSPNTPVNQLSMFRRCSPLAYECGLTQLLCSPYRQRPSTILGEHRKPIVFSFRGDLPVTDLASPGAQQLKKAPPHQSDSNQESELDSKPAAVNPPV